MPQDRYVLLKAMNRVQIYSGCNINLDITAPSSRVPKYYF